MSCSWQTRKYARSVAIKGHQQNVGKAPVLIPINLQVRPCHFFRDFYFHSSTSYLGLFLILGAAKPVFEAEVFINLAPSTFALDQNVACSSFHRIANGFGSFRRGQSRILPFGLPIFYCFWLPISSRLFLLYLWYKRLTPSKVQHWARDLPFSNDTTGPLAFSPPKYPSPWASGSGEWADAYARARAFVSQLTLLEKVNLTTGVG